MHKTLITDQIFGRHYHHMLQLWGCSTSFAPIDVIVSSFLSYVISVI